MLPGVIIAGWAGAYETVDLRLPDPLIARWSVGSNKSYSDGLKGGIAWAIDPKLCEQLTPLFPEETLWHKGYFFPDVFWQAAMPSLLRCEHLKNTIRTAMRAWEAANTNIRFFEVSSLCDEAWVSPGGELPPSPNSDFAPEGLRGEK